MTAPNLEQIIADTLDSIPADLRPTQIINAERAQKIVAAIRDSGYTVIALPNHDEYCGRGVCAKTQGHPGKCSV